MEYKLTDQEIAEVKATGGDIAEAQKAKRQAYIDSGGVILNPYALEDMYEGLKGLLRDYSTNPLNDSFYEACRRARQAIAKADGK